VELDQKSGKFTSPLQVGRRRARWKCVKHENSSVDGRQVRGENRSSGEESRGQAKREHGGRRPAKLAIIDRIPRGVNGRCG